ncbi:hypothetical protein ACN38_g9697 [Penicillium nordicum]|uniref:Uncharacterized protein n=1 Tax=Penicillium nordicum TaxID=229535 RepID=A0A0M8NXT1_9EURO|nr:hypothetical protein ACN38_g9697 [Penicillium nordicum]
MQATIFMRQMRLSTWRTLAHYFHCSIYSDYQLVTMNSYSRLLSIYNHVIDSANLGKLPSGPGTKESLDPLSTLECSKVDDFNLPGA